MSRLLSAPLPCMGGERSVESMLAAGQGDYLQEVPNTLVRLGSVVTQLVSLPAADDPVGLTQLSLLPVAYGPVTGQDGHLLLMSAVVESFAVGLFVELFEA